ncbi:hypothetical protein A2U01_0118959 [Trifolium medium]|uniref:Uncharacterized protein n=1 Tax=Trifolium medium TaxID=97028 RepID=A0A392WAG0_9FABA|nr:hypothetical protein [Trifolium medium]
MLAQRAFQRARQLPVAFSRSSKEFSDFCWLSVAFSRPVTTLFTGLTDC